MKIIIGLGNPDPQYHDTRHNVGFMFLHWLTREVRASSFETDQKLKAEVSSGKIGSAKILLIKPLTFVNNSGDIAKKLAKSYKLQAKSFIIVHDDLDVPFGNAKLKFASNSGGHKGIDSIIKALKTNEFYRLKIGTANKEMEKMRSAPAKRKIPFVTKFVLSGFTHSEQEKLKSVFRICLEKLNLILVN